MHSSWWWHCRTRASAVQAWVGVSCYWCAKHQVGWSGHLYSPQGYVPPLCPRQVCSQWPCLATKRWARTLHRGGGGVFSWGPDSMSVEASASVLVKICYSATSSVPLNPHLSPLKPHLSPCLVYLPAAAPALSQLAAGDNARAKDVAAALAGLQAAEAAGLVWPPSSEAFIWETSRASDPSQPPTTEPSIAAETGGVAEEGAGGGVSKSSLSPL